MGETRVDLQHLLEDLRDAYTGAIEETILTEIIANALDSGATRIRLLTGAAATLTVIDDGRGMQRRELSRYHDIATSSKARGEGIGFAGVGIKLGLLISREVVTETRRGSSHVATRWHLASRHRAPWKWIPPPGLTQSRGTAVQLVLANPLSPLLDAGYLEETIGRHFAPLFESVFDDLLRRHYPQGVAFDVDGHEVRPATEPASERVPVAIRLGRKRLPSAVGFIARSAASPPDAAGIAISTFGKVIKRGWDWLGLTPARNVTGIIEAPELAMCLTLSKNDFIRSGPRGATYLAYRKAIQEIVSRQLSAWDEGRDREGRPRTERLERDLARVLEDLSDDFPLLRSLVERRRGGQKQLPMAGRGPERVPTPLFAGAGDDGDDTAAAGAPSRDPDLDGRDNGAPPVQPSDTPAEPTSDRNAAGPSVPPGSDPASAGAVESSVTTLQTVAGKRRPGRYGLTVRFESRPDDLELARLVDNSIWINDAHPAYRRAAASRALGYHTALAVALALAPLAVGARDEHAFLTEFLSQWGAAHGGGSRRSSA